jgi:hypothetical protein
MRFQPMTAEVEVTDMQMHSTRKERHDTQQQSDTETR